MKFYVFLMPVIALVLVIALFIVLLKKAENKPAFKRVTIVILVIAFILNVLWEIIQIPLYQGASYNIDHITFCALASVADALTVLLLYYCFAFIYKNLFWLEHLTLAKILILMLTGGIGAIATEMGYLAAGTWMYSKYMPIIPIVNAGLSPVLQFMLLPGCVYYLSLRKMKNTYSKANFHG